VIVVSLVLFLAGVALLAAGLVSESISLEVASIASALLSALVLYLGVRQRRPLTEPGSLEPAPPAGSEPAPVTAERFTEATPRGGDPATPADAPTAVVPAGTWAGATPEDASAPAASHGATAMAAPVEAPAQTAPADAPSVGAADVPETAVPVQYADEPDEEPVRAPDVDWISAQPDVVGVVDGHPRYHVGKCPSLRDQEVFAMPVSEARESGFTPCGRCRPDSTILDSAWRSHRSR